MQCCQHICRARLSRRPCVLLLIHRHISRGTRWAAAAKQLKDQGWLQTPEGDDEEQWLLKDEERIELQKRPGWARQFSREVTSGA